MLLRDFNTTARLMTATDDKCHDKAQTLDSRVLPIRIIEKTCSWGLALLRRTRFALLIAPVFFAAMPLCAQQAIILPAFKPSIQESAAQFSFVADGPRGPGWTRPDQIARAYFRESLPAFFRRSIELSEPLPTDARLEWIFTGPHAGFTVSLSPTQVRLTQRYYDSIGLESNGGNYPQRTTENEARILVGTPRSVEVVVDSHLSVNVLINGALVLTEHLVFDVTRHQLMLDAPRTQHIVVTGKLSAR